MRKIIFILFLVSINLYSQTDFFDYLVTTENDTITGLFRGNYLIDLNGEKHKLNKSKHLVVKTNDFVYKLEKINIKEFNSIENDSLISFRAIDQKLVYLPNKSSFYIRFIDRELRKDYIVNINSDTIYGQIKTINNKIITEKGESIKIKPKSVKEYRKDGYCYYYKRKRKVTYDDDKSAYLKLIYDGRVKLYEYFLNTTLSVKTGSKISDNYTYYNGYSRFYIERNNQIELISNQRIFSIIKDILPENKELLEKIKTREFTYDDIYIIVKYFNENSA